MKKILFPLVLAYSSNILCMDSLGPSRIKQKYYDQRQEHKNAYFVQTPNDDEKRYSDRLVQALKKGPVSATEQISGALVVHGALELKNFIYPNPKDVFTEKMQLLEERSQIVSPSIDMVKMLEKSFLTYLPDGEQEAVRAELEEIKDCIFSSEFYENQTEKAALSKLYEMNKLVQRIALLESMKGMLHDKDLAYREKYLTRFSYELKKLVSDYHDVIVHEKPLEEPGYDSSLKEYARDGVIFAAGAGVTVGISYLLGFTLPTSSPAA